MAEIEILIYWKFTVIHCLTAMAIIYLEQLVHSAIRVWQKKERFRESK